jgi:hypothetical protein
MKFPQFSKINRHRTFNYTPVYYNPEKEELDKRVKAIEAELDGENVSDVDREARLRSQFQRNATSMGYKSQSFAKSMRMIIILVLVLYLSYVVFSNLDGFLGKFFK